LWKRVITVAALLGFALAAMACRSGIYTDWEREMGIRALHPPANMSCKDGRPVKLLVGSVCNMGICGWTCEADRWSLEK
jgi:hypothetical protein